jgi:hypothetical protein
MGLAAVTRHRPRVLKEVILMTTAEEKQTIIVTFHRKDRRSDQSSDKVELARRMVKDADHILDVDLYDAPILILNATGQEIDRLRNDANIAAVEEDGLCKAQGDSPTGEVTPHAETLPGVRESRSPSSTLASTLCIRISRRTSRGRSVSSRVKRRPMETATARIPPESLRQQRMGRGSSASLPPRGCIT